MGWRTFSGVGQAIFSLLRLNRKERNRKRRGREGRREGRGKGS